MSEMKTMSDVVKGAVDRKEWKVLVEQWKKQWREYFARTRGSFFCWHKYVRVKGEHPPYEVSRKVAYPYGTVWVMESMRSAWSDTRLKRCVKCGKTRFITDPGAGGGMLG